MIFRFFFITILFSTIASSKEITVSSIDTDLRKIKIATTTSMKKAKNVVGKLIYDYDVLTLKHKYYEHYIVNIDQKDYETVLSNIKQYFPTAFRSNKNIFKTSGIILFDEQNKDIKKSILDNNSSIKELNIAITDTNATVFQDLNTTDELNTINEANTTQIDRPSKTINKDESNQKIINVLQQQNIKKSSQKDNYLLDSNLTNKINSNIDNKINIIDAVLQTLSLSNKIKASREKMIQSKHNIDIAYGNYYPSIDATYSIVRTKKTPGDQNIYQTLDPSKYYNDEQYSLTLSQNIYAGGQTQNEIERLKAQYLIAKTDYERLLEEEIFKAITSYIDVVFTRDAMQANKKNMEELKTIFDIVKIKFDAGALSLGELRNIEASIANAKSKLSRTNSKFNNAIEYFKFLTGELFEETYPYEKIVHVEITPLEEILEKVPEKNSAIKSFNYNILSKKFNLKKLQAPFRPQIDLLLSANKVTDQENFENVEDSYIAKLLVNYNLFNGNKDKNNYLKAFSAIQEIVYEKEAEIRKISWELEKLHISLTSIQENLDNVEDEVNASKSMVGSYWESFRNGEQDLNVLLQGQRQLNTAELDFIQSQQDSMKDYFEILKLSGNLLSHFQIDISKENYLDLAKAKYRAQYKPEEQEESNILKNSPIKREDINASKLVQQITEKTNIESDLTKLLSFHEKFLIQNPQDYTILIKDFDRPMDGLKKILDLNISNSSFIYENFENEKIKTNIVYGIFSTVEDANISINEKLSQIDSNNATIEKISKVQNNFREFSKLLFVNADDIPKPIIKEKILVEKIRPFETNTMFKEKFLNAPQEYFTINITTFPSLKTAGEFIQKEKIENKSFVFEFGKEKKWYKHMYGVFETYEKAKEVLDSLDSLKTSYMPIIEKIQLKQELYQRFNEK